MLKSEAIRVAAELGNAVPVEYTSPAVKGYTVIPSADMIVGGEFLMNGFVWKIEHIDYNQTPAKVTLSMVRGVGGWELF